MIKDTERQFIKELVWEGRDFVEKPATKQELYYISKWLRRGWWVGATEFGFPTEKGRIALIDLFTNSLSIPARPMSEKRLRGIHERADGVYVQYDQAKDGGISKWAKHVHWAEGYAGVPISGRFLEEIAISAVEDRRTLLRYVQELQGRLNKIEEADEARKRTVQDLKDHLDSPEHRMNAHTSAVSHFLEDMGKGPTARRLHHMAVFTSASIQTHPLAHVISHSTMEEIRGLLREP